METYARHDVPYEILEHTADTGIEARTSTFAGLIGELATGMFALMAVVDPCPETGLIEVEVEGGTAEDLVVDVLSELLYRSEVEDLVLCGFETRVAGDSIHVTAGGAPIANVDVTGSAIKAVTYHDLVVEERDGGWFGRVYFDV